MVGKVALAVLINQQLMELHAVNVNRQDHQFPRISMTGLLIVVMGERRTAARAPGSDQGAFHFFNHTHKHS